MILIISTCQEKLSELEFVKPVAELVEGERRVKHYKDITEQDLKADKIIICGTALQDFEYLKHLDKFTWIKTIKKPVLGICAGFQILAKILGYELTEETTIGPKEKKYYLHTKTVEDKEVIKQDNLTAYLFHPEVLNENIIKEFCK